MKRSYFFTMLFLLAMGFATKTTYAATNADSIAVTLWCGINDSLYNASAGGVWVTGDFTAPIVHGNTDFWWHMPLDSMGKYNGVDTIIWYKIVFHYKPGSMLDSSVSTHANAEMAHDSAFWYFSLAGTWDLSETVGAPCNLGWGVNRGSKFGDKDTTLAFLWEKCPQLADPSIITGLKRIVAAQLTVSPNPATDLVKLESTSGIRSIKITDMTGRTVKNIMANGNSVINISVADLPNSLYLLRIAYTNGTAVTSKLLKQ